MPNYVPCVLQLTGPPEDVQAFLEACKTSDDDFSFAPLVPRPSDKELGREATDLGDGLQGYPVKGPFGAYPLEWEVQNWGTKWDACEPEVDAKKQLVRFETAWSPPCAWVLKASATKLAERLNLTLHWVDESGCGTISGNEVLGTLCASKGKVVSKIDLTRASRDVIHTFLDTWFPDSEFGKSDEEEEEGEEEEGEGKALGETEEEGDEADKNKDVDEKQQSGHKRKSCCESSDSAGVEEPPRKQLKSASSVD